jgi:hypothetical protein
MNNVEMVSNNYGLTIYPTNSGNVSATVTNSLFSDNNFYAFYNGETSSGTGTSVLHLERCIASGNEYGIYTNNNSPTDVTLLSNCTITKNTMYGVYKMDGSSGTIYSRQNNTVAGNSTDSNITPTPLPAW